MAEEEKIRRRGEGHRETQNPYYLRVSGVYRALKWGTLLLFSLYLVCMLAVQRDSITYDNLMYLMRDLNLNTGDDAPFTTAAYEEQQNMRFSVFQNTLAVAGSSGVRLYDSGGSCIFSDSVSFQSPILECGDKYMLLYDSGGSEYALFTSLACVERGSTDGMLQCAAVSDSGAYCTVARSDETKYVITLYSASFRQLARYYRDSYVIAAAVHPDGGSLAVISTASGDWTLASEVTVYSASSSDTVRVSLGSSLPLAVRYLSNGNIAVICDDGAVFLTAAGEVIARQSLSSMTLSYFSVSDNKVALVCQENVLGSSSRILVLDSTGGIMCDTRRSDKIVGITAASGENSAYIRYSSYVETLSVLGSETCSAGGHILDVCEIGGRGVVCYPAQAVALDKIKE